MFRHRRIKINKGYVEAFQMDLASRRLIVLRARRGYLMCGYLNLRAAQKFRDAAAKIVGVATIEEALRARVSACTSYARRLGIYQGQPVKEALKAIL
jgi:uncharacterized protein YunC (DUF1805 family)